MLHYAKVREHRTVGRLSFFFYPCKDEIVVAVENEKMPCSHSVMKRRAGRKPSEAVGLSGPGACVCRQKTSSNNGNSRVNMKNVIFI